MSTPPPRGKPIGTTPYRAGTKVSIIRDKLQGYVSGSNESPGSAVISELLQNADDAKATEVRFRFYDGYLEVWNNSCFGEEDFTNIQELMAAGKADQRDTIGAFGTGFISTYHLTDSPELLSMKRHLIFDPFKDEIPVYQTDIQDETIFRFPWRIETSDLARKIGARIWKPKDIEDIKRGIGLTLYRFSLFLRNVGIIEVYEGDSCLLVRIERKPPSSAWQVGKIKAERRTIICTGDDAEHAEDEWIYYRRQIEHDFDLDDVTVKDNTVAIAFPVRSRPWLKRHVPASIYNFLPTAIHTDLAFQINGAFFPDNNRRGILLDQATQPEKVAWNKHVIAQAGAIFAEVVNDIRDRVETKRLYELFPLTYREGIENIQVVRNTFIAALPNLAIIKSSRDKWLKPDEITLPGDSDLTRLANAYLDILPKGSPKALQQILHQLGCSTLKLDTVLRMLEPFLESGTRLAKGCPHPMIDNRQKLEWLYNTIDREMEGVQFKPNADRTAYLADLPIFLSEDGKLYRAFDDHWCGGNEVRLLCFDGTPRFVDLHIQQVHYQSFVLLLDLLNGSALVKHYLADLLCFKAGTHVDSQDVPTIIRGRSDLERLLRILTADIEHIDLSLFRRLPLVLDGAGQLHPASGAVRRPAGDDQTLLERIGIPFIDAGFANDPDIWRLYQKVGIAEVNLADVIAELKRHYEVPTTLGTSDLPLDSVDDLQMFFEYLHRQVAKLPPQARATIVEQLAALAIFPTSGGRLMPAIGDEPLMISAEADARSLTVLKDVLKQDVLIDTAFLRGNVPEFLTEVLGIEKLTPLALLRDYVRDHYHDPTLSDAERLALLSLAHDLHNDPSQRDAVIRLLREPEYEPLALVRYCNDLDLDGYQSSEPIYFDTNLTRAVLTDGFLRPHPQYDSQWKALLEAIGVKREPPITEIAERLLALVRNGEEPPLALYTALARGWKQLVSRKRLQLSDEAIFWDGQRYWPADQVLADDQINFFGKRRAYLAQFPTPVRELLKCIVPEPIKLEWYDHLGILAEIASDYTDGKVVAEDDLTLLCANAAKVNPALWGGRLTELDARTGDLPTRPIVLTATRQLRAVDGQPKQLMVATGPGAAEGIPEILLDQIELVDTSFAAAGEYLLRDLLGVQQIAPYSVAHNTFVRVYVSCDDHQVRFELLTFLLKLWDKLSKTQEKNLLQCLAHVQIIRADDDQYYPPSQISFDTSDLDTVFSQGPYRPRRPHICYSIPKRTDDLKAWEKTPWVQLFCSLGVHTRPATDDLLAAIQAVLIGNTCPSQANSQAIGPIYTWLRANIAVLDAEDDADFLQQLTKLSWLPAKLADSWGWYQPAQVYAASHRALVGAQAPVLSFPDPNSGMQEQIGFPKEPAPCIVADNLLALIRQQFTQEPGTLKRIHAFLGQHWNALDADYQEAMREQPVVWAQGKWWQAAHVIPVKQESEQATLRRLFGHRRALVQMYTDRQAFFQAISISYDPIQNHVTLLQEIAAEYANDHKLLPEDHILLIANFNHLGSQSRDEQTDTTLRNLTIVPGRDQRLHRCASIVLADASQSQLLQRFRETALSIVADQALLQNADSRGQDSAGQKLPLTENGFKLLRRLGVQLLALGAGVERRLIAKSNPKMRDDLTARIRALTGPFRRILRTLENKESHISAQASSLDDLAYTKCLNCDQLTIQYVVTLPSGTTIEAPPNHRDRALFTYDDKGKPELYGRNWNTPDTLTDIAIDLELVFFPGGSVSTTLEQLLRCKTTDEAHRFLSRHRFLSELGEEPAATEEAWEDDPHTDEESHTTYEEYPSSNDVALEPASGSSGIAALKATNHNAQQNAASTPSNDGLTPRPDAATPMPGSGATLNGPPPLPPQPAQSMTPSLAPRSNVPTPNPGQNRKRSGKRSRKQQPDAGQQSKKSNSAPHSAWAPVCDPGKARFHLQPFQPTQRTIRAHGQANGQTDPMLSTSAPKTASNSDAASSKMSQADRQRIGQWGEQYVFNYLLHTMQQSYPDGTLTKTPNSFAITRGGSVVVSVRWLNNDGNEAVGHDILLTEGSVTHYIEVKATTEVQKEWLQVSGAQWEFARKHGPCFHIYRVFNAGTQTPSIQIIDDPIARWQRGDLIVDPLRIYA